MGQVKVNTGLIRLRHRDQTSQATASTSFLTSRNILSPPRPVHRHTPPCSAVAARELCPEPGRQWAEGALLETERPPLPPQKHSTQLLSNQPHAGEEQRDGWAVHTPAVLTVLVCQNWSSVVCMWCCSRAGRRGLVQLYAKILNYIMIP